MLRQLDQLCRWTGLRRLGDFQEVRCWGDSDFGTFNATVFLAADGKRHDYTIKYYRDRGHLSLSGFRPEDSAVAGKDGWRDFKGLGYDTLKDRRARDFAAAAVKKLNQHLQWSLASGPAVQKIGASILISFTTVSSEELKKPGAAIRYVDPYASFIVSPKGTVIAGWFGA
jgi:hypothetical protein